MYFQISMFIINFLLISLLFLEISALTNRNRNNRTFGNRILKAKVNELDCGKTPIHPDFKHIFYLNLTSPSKKKQARIVGGSIAKPYSWPWQIVWCEVIGGICHFQCGGTVIHNRWVLTAGHCVYGKGRQDRPDKFRVKAGVFDRSRNDEPGEVVHKVKAMYLHPNYNTPEYDIALIELETPIIYSQHVQPICLPSVDFNQIRPSNTAWAIGWGLIIENGFTSEQLRQVSLPINNNNTCKKVYPNIFKHQIMICAGAEGKDSCQGDSGGPFQQINQHGRWFQYGITSFGVGCARAGFPGVYTRASYFCSYIAKTTRGDVKCYNPNQKY